MKPYAFFAAFAAIVHAAEEPFSPRDVFLMIESDLPALNGSWVHVMFGGIKQPTLADQTKVRASTHCRDASPIVVSAYNQQPLQLQLNSWDINYDLGLRLERVGYHSLVNLYEPNDTKIKAFGKSTEWSIFTLDKDGYLGVDDGLLLPHRKWMVDLDDAVTEDVADFELNGGYSYNATFDHYSFGLWDGVTPQTRPLREVKLIAKPGARSRVACELYDPAEFYCPKSNSCYGHYGEPGY